MQLTGCHSYLWTTAVLCFSASNRQPMKQKLRWLCSNKLSNTLIRPPLHTPVRPFRIQSQEAQNSGFSVGPFSHLIQHRKPMYRRRSPKPFLSAAFLLASVPV